MTKHKISLRDWLDGEQHEFVEWVGKLLSNEEEVEIIKVLFERFSRYYVLLKQGETRVAACLGAEEMKKELISHLEKVLGGPLTADDYVELEDFIEKGVSSLHSEMLSVDGSGQPTSTN